MQNKKMMTIREMKIFIDKIGRKELYDELEFINKKEYFNPINLIGRDSCYLKAIRVALVTLGYDELWVDGPFRTLLEERYYNNGNDWSNDIFYLVMNDFYTFYPNDDDLKNVEKYFLKRHNVIISDNNKLEVSSKSNVNISKNNQVLPDLNIKNINLKKRKIVQYALDGKFIAIFDSIQEANKLLGKKPYATSIGDCCRGNTNSAYGYIWRYLDDVKK